MSQCVRHDATHAKVTSRNFADRSSKHLLISISNHLWEAL